MPAKPAPRHPPPPRKRPPPELILSTFLTLDKKTCPRRDKRRNDRFPKDRIHQQPGVPLVNTVMISGKTTVAQLIVYGAFDHMAEKNPASNPLEVLQRAVDNPNHGWIKARRVAVHVPGYPLKCPRSGSLRWRCGGWSILLMREKASRCERPGIGRFWKLTRPGMPIRPRIKLIKWRKL